MSLPKVKTPTFNLVLPSNGQKVRYRPFQVKEEKILLVAQQSDDRSEQIDAVKTIINNCIVEPEDFDVTQLASFDIEFIFLKLRAKSVGEIVELQITPQEREGLPPQKVKVNIDDIEPTFDPKHKKVIKIDDQFSVEMKYPTFELITKLDNASENPEELFDLFCRCMKTIYNGEEAYDLADFTREEAREWLDELTASQLQELQTFFQTIPRIRKDLEYSWTSEDGTDSHEETITVVGLLNFLS